MAACSACGASNPDEARFCLSCGSSLRSALGASEVRKVVTILFTDVTGSTALGERLDPEAVRDVIGAYFAAARETIELHGGTVEKFIGDAVMAVFGIPHLHEDDALRAVRAADAVRTRLAALNEDVRKRHGIELSTRTGINTGEVVAGDASAQTLVTGDAVNTAARLEQAADPGGILLGDLTYRLVRSAVDAVSVDPIPAKGKAEPVRAYRLERVAPTPGTPRTAGPLVGREAEIQALLGAFEAATARTTTLVTILAQAGVGKSRLLRELVARLPPGTRTIRGRCLPYGDGTAFWPIREAMREAAGIIDGDSAEVTVAKLAALAQPDPAARAIGEGVAQLMSISGVQMSQEDAFWATRRAFERLAADGPLVAVFEDLHWADAGFLDLIEYVIDLTAESPILILATARPELLESRPTWASGREHARLLRLEPLDADDVAALCRAQDGGEALPADVVARIAEAAEGNPLFVEEMVAMLRDDGMLRAADGRWALVDGGTIGIPPTVRALIAARLDMLPPPARQVAARGSVIGRVFETATLAQITPDELRSSLTAQLLTLVRRELIRPAHPELGSGDAFAFRHVLIRDAAYDALPKRERAELHERLADWIEVVTGDELPQYQEIVAHHLAEAARYRSALGAEEAARALARRASTHLAAIGIRAASVGAVRRAATLFRKALDLAGPDADAELLFHAGEALGRMGDPDGVRLLEQADERARATGEQEIAAVARVVHSMLQTFNGATPSEEALATVESALEELQRSGSAWALGRAWSGIGFVKWGLGALREAFEADEKAIEYARAAGEDARARRIAAIEGGLLIDGWTPLSEGLAWGERTLAEIGDSPNVRYPVLEALGWLRLYVGEHDAAREAFREAQSIAEELGQTSDATFIKLGFAEAEEAAGTFVAAEHVAIEAMRRLEEIGSVQVAFAAAVVARTRAARGDTAGALHVLDTHAPPDGLDVNARAEWLGARALALLGSGRPDEALNAADEALRAIETTEFIILRARILEILGLIELARGDSDAARAHLQEALGYFTHKGARPAMERAQRLIDNTR